MIKIHIDDEQHICKIMGMGTLCDIQSDLSFALFMLAKTAFEDDEEKQKEFVQDFLTDNMVICKTWFNKDKESKDDKGEDKK